MHTVRYAERDHRLIFCPEPPESEVRIKQDAGILQLIKSARARAMGSDYAPVLAALTEQHEQLLVRRSSERLSALRKTSNSTDQQLDKFLGQ